MSLKVGFLVDNEEILDHYKSIIDFVQNCPQFSQPIIISDYVENNKILRYTNFKILKNLLRNLLMKFISYTEKKYLIKEKGFQNFNKKYKTKDFGLETILIKTIKYPNNIRRISDTDSKKLKIKNFDVIIRCGNGIILGDILTIPKQGIFSFHHGDNREFRGMPSGFWEVVNNSPSTGFIVQRLTEELDKGEVLARGNIMTSSYWIRNNALITQKSIKQMTNLLSKLSKGQKLESERNVAYSDTVFKNPALNDLFKYILLQMILISKRLAVKLVKPKNWEVRIAECSDLYSLPMSKFHTLKPPKGSFVADPFLISFENKVYCFVEEFLIKSRKGIISAYEVSKANSKYLGHVIKEDFHLSFPFIFEYEGNLYMVPESAKNRTINLYKCTNFPKSWVFEKTLISDVAAVDTMIFNHEGKWMMATSICSTDIGDHNSELHIFFPEGNDPLSSEWKKHELNPVIFDSRKARNAGLVIDNGSVFRVGQMQAKGKYGHSISLNKINKVNKNEFSETCMIKLQPESFNNVSHIHHLSKKNKLVAYDVCEIK